MMDVLRLRSRLSGAVTGEHDEVAGGWMRGSVRAFPASSMLPCVPALLLNPIVHFRQLRFTVQTPLHVLSGAMYPFLITYLG